jgi:hypothetical protein
MAVRRPRAEGGPGLRRVRGHGCAGPARTLAPAALRPSPPQRALPAASSEELEGMALLLLEGLPEA